MGYPTVAEALCYKSRTSVTQTRAAVGLDYPVFSGAFSDDFAGVALDADKWFSNVPSWGSLSVAGGTVTLAITADGDGIAPPWIQSRHNLAFPISRETDWEFNIRFRFPVFHGFGAFIRICGRSFRDAEAIWAVKGNETDGITVHMPDGYAVNNIIVSTWNDTSWKRIRVNYYADTQQYRCRVDGNDDGVFDSDDYVDVDGRYADAIVIGNSTAVQGQLGRWTQVEVDSVSVSGTAESVEDPDWAAPFEYDGVRMSWLPTVLGGRVSCDKDNQVDAAELELDNFGLAEFGERQQRMYTAMRFLNRRCLIQGRAGDGSGAWAPWETLFDGLCSEKQVRLDEDGRCLLTLPVRDRWRAVADDMEVNGAYSDAGAAIEGVGMNMTVAEIIEDIYGDKCGLPAAAYDVVALPNNVPRNYNVFRTSAQQAVRTLCEHAALAIYQRRSDARIEVQEWHWGTDSPGYHMSTAEEIRLLTWSESAFDVTSAEQMTIGNTELGSGGFTHTWPPHREPFYGRLVHSDAVVLQTSVQHDARPVAALRWWARNRKLGGIEVTAVGQFWVEHDLEIGVKDDRFLGFGRGECWIVDGWEHSWREDEPCVTRIRLINAHPDRFLRQGLPS